MDLFAKLGDYIKNSRLELKKVIWPDKKTTINHTVLVIGFSLGVAAFLGAVDYIFTTILNLVIGI